MTEYSSAHIDEIEAIDDGQGVMRPVRKHFGISSFGVNAFTAREVGDRLVGEHDESDNGSEELYFVLHGHARFEVAGDRLDARAGTFVFVPPDTKRSAVAEEPGTTIVAIGAYPGKPYEAIGWEAWVPIRPLYEAGRHDEAIAQTRALLGDDPDNALLLFNLACLESLTGQREEALEHLRHSVELSDHLRSLAQSDSDLDPIREEPGFKAMFAG